jgi:NlpC/P60 family putative phage cell wall peptidase
MTERTVDELRAAVVAEAWTWLRTPYIHLADIKGIGADCAMILVRVYQAVGIVPDFDPRPYEPEWFLHQDEERYMAGLEKYSHRVETPGLGDIALYRMGRTASHGAIIVSDQHVIHAYRPHGNVELCERHSAIFFDQKGRSRLDSCWSVFT